MTPIRLNMDSGSNAQWMPSLSVTSGGVVHAYWYDRRNTTDGQNYEVWGRQSADNGATWLPEESVSTVLIPQPEQPDTNVQTCYAGDYNYATAFGSTHYATWTDGRVLVKDKQNNDHSQQDVFFAAVPPATSTPDFSVNVNPSSLTIPQGGSGTSTTTVASTDGFSSAVALACSGQPAGVTCAFVPDTVTPPPDGSTTSVLTVGVGASVPAGNYLFNVQGTSGALTRTAKLNLHDRHPQMRMGVENGRKPVGVLVRERFDEDSIDHAEDRAVRANPERQSDDGHGCKPRGFREHPQSIAQILPHRVHVASTDHRLRLQTLGFFASSRLCGKARPQFTTKTRRITKRFPSAGKSFPKKRRIYGLAGLRSEV